MALTDYVIMPGEDYQAICDAVREKRNETEVIKSGEIAGKIQGIETADVDPLAKFIGETRVALMRGEIINDEYHTGSMYARSTASMFNHCPSLTTVPLFDTSSVDTMNNMFSNCSSLTTVPLFDTSSVTNMNSMFSNCSSLTTVPLFDTSSVIGMNNMFSNCSSLTTVPLFDTSSVTNMDSMFSNCSSLTTVPLFDTSSVTNMSDMFNRCTSLTTVPLFDTSSVTYMINVFSNCNNLTTVPSFDMSSVTITNTMFNNCSSLTECWLRNIKTSLQVGSGTVYGHLLTIDSLIHLIYECRDTGSRKTLTVGSANLEKLANVYVRTIEITDEMRAEDAYIDEKLPFEVCESTDEDAMLIIDYAAEKKWSIK